MSVAALYDLHGNLPALGAVLADLDRVGAEHVLIGGDVAYGPFVRETLDRLLALGDRAIWIRGNADRELVEFFDTGRTRAPVSEDTLRALAWEASRLERRHRDFLAALPPTRRLEVEGLGPVLFCHGSPHSDEEIITAVTPDARLRRLLGGVTERVVVCGHTHVQFARELDGRQVLNAGSVGLPYQEPSGAYWAWLGPGLELRRTAYDPGRAAARIRASGHPLAEEFARILEQPPSAEETGAFFERLACEREEAGGAQV